MSTPIGSPDASAEPHSTLPSYSDEQLAHLDANALIDLLIADEDRVPRNVIDAAARLGDSMVVALQERFPAMWNDAPSTGQWWFRLHAAMVLGLIAGEQAGLLLVEWIRGMAIDDDHDLQDWLAGSAPALFANKPASVVASLRDLSTDVSLGWYYRTNAADAVLAAALREGPAELDAALDWVAGIAADDDELWEMRLSCGNSLLDFPRERHRPLVDELARRQHSMWSANFTASDVSRAYRIGDEPSWTRFDNPWRFYTPAEIRRRQERWAREETDDEAEDHFVDEDNAFEPVQPFVRDAPKIGRNDPCPCGSGKKYKKCCMGG